MRKVEEQLKLAGMNVQFIECKHPILRVQKSGEDAPYHVDISISGHEGIHKSHMVRGTCHDACHCDGSKSGDMQGLYRT
jgi:hypothetical protein